MLTEPGDDARVVLQEGLGEVLAVLKGTLQRYPALQSPEIFIAARTLISKIRCEYDWHGCVFSNPHISPGVGGRTSPRWLLDGLLFLFKQVFYVI